MRDVLFIGYDIKKGVRAITNINVCGCRWSVEMLRPGSPSAPKSMGSPVVYAGIGFRFHNTTGTTNTIPPRDQNFSQQFTCNLYNIFPVIKTGVKLLGLTGHIDT